MSGEVHGQGPVQAGVDARHLIQKKIKDLRYERNALAPYKDYPEVEKEMKGIDRSLALCFADMKWMRDGRPE